MNGEARRLKNTCEKENEEKKIYKERNKVLVFL